MHILLIHQAFAAINEPGGTRHHEFARLLVQQGHRVTVITSPVSYLTGSAAVADRGAGDEDGVQILRAYTYNALHRSFVHRVFSFISFMVSSFIAGLRIQDVDLVWGTSPPLFQGGTAWTLARIKNVPFLFEVRDLWPDFAVAVGVLKNPLLISASRWLERFLYRGADHVLVNSPGFIEHVQAHGANEVTLIPNGSDAAMFDPAHDGSSFRKDHNLGNKFIALYAGAHGLSNDLEIVLGAAHILRDQQDIAIVLLGDGKDKAALVQRSIEMGLDNVHFLPPLPKSEMAQALAAADACIAILKPIALYKTVFPNKVFDYMAAGRPVLLAIDGVIREVIENAEAGTFVPPGDPLALAQAITRFATDPQTARQLGLKGRAYLEENFDRLTLASKLHQVIMDVRSRKARTL